MAGRERITWDGREEGTESIRAWNRDNINNGEMTSRMRFGIQQIRI